MSGENTCTCTSVMWDMFYWHDSMKKRRFYCSGGTIGVSVLRMCTDHCDINLQALLLLERPREVNKVSTEVFSTEVSLTKEAELLTVTFSFLTIWLSASLCLLPKIDRVTPFSTTTQSATLSVCVCPVYWQTELSCPGCEFSVSVLTMMRPVCSVYSWGTNVAFI